MLLALAQDPRARVAELARTVGIAERSTYRILRDLERAGFIVRERHGRLNSYRVDAGRRLGEPAVGDERVAGLLALVPAPQERGGDSCSSRRPARSG